jgi:hypothetical protein
MDRQDGNAVPVRDFYQAERRTRQMSQEWRQYSGVFRVLIEEHGQNLIFFEAFECGSQVYALADGFYPGLRAQIGNGPGYSIVALFGAYRVHWQAVTGENSRGILPTADVSRHENSAAPQFQSFPDMFLASNADKFVYFGIHDRQADKFHQRPSEMRISAADYFTRLAIPHAQHPRRPRTRARGPVAREKTEETPAEFPYAHGGFMSQCRADSHE